MALTHKNRLKTAVSAVASSGLGAFTIGAAASGYRTFGASDDGNTFDVLIIEGTEWEVRTDCTYTHSGTSLARGTLEDSSTGSAIAFTAAAIVVETLSAGRANTLARTNAANTFTGKQTFGTFNTGDSNIVSGSLEVQPFSLNNVFLAENCIYNGGWKYRAAGAASMFYFNNGEGQFRVFNTGAAGASLPNSGNSTQLKLHHSGKVALGGLGDQGSGSYVGCAVLIDVGSLRMGATDVAAPAAQTISAQGSRAGADTNTGGGNLTLQSGNGTGTGGPSSLILQSPVATTSGTGAQTQTTGLTIKNGCAVPRATTVASLPAAASNTDAMLIVTDASATLAAGIGTTVAAGGANRVGVRSDGTNWIISF